MHNFGQALIELNINITPEMKHMGENEIDYMASRFDDAVRLLPPDLRERARKLSRTDRAMAEEIRIRVGRCMTVLLPEGERRLGAEIITVQDIERLMDIATQASMHTAMVSLKNGYITVRGGCRIGICGTAILKNGEISGIRDISSLSIRIAKQIRGAADSVINEIVINGSIKSTLIISPPGGGKTTLLRDIVRIISDGDKQNGLPPMRTAVADERGEIGAILNGMPQMDIGEHTDVLEGCPKAKGAIMLVRAMNPQVLAMDEITAPEDIDAVLCASNCGVKLIATVHGDSVEDIKRKPLYTMLLKQGVFEKAITIKGKSRYRTYEVTEIKEERNAENHRSRADTDVFGNIWNKWYYEAE